VEFRSSDGRAVLPATYTFTAADHGVHTFTGLVLDTAGTQSLTVRDSASSSITGSGSVAVSPAAASRLVISGFPSATTAGTAGKITVTARDAFGNVATGYTGTVHFTSSDPQAALPADYTFTTADAGRRTFSTVLKTAGTQSLTAKDTVNRSLTWTEAGIAVSPAAASRLAVSAPAGATAGTAFNVTVTAQDAYGNTATGYAGTVHFTSSDGQAVLPINSTLSNGTGVFSVTLRTAGSQTLTATDTASGTITGNAAVSVSPAGSGALMFHATDLPQSLNPSDVFVSSVINVSLSVTIASVKVQVNITYPLDSDLRIDLLYIDSGGVLRSSLVLSDFVGAGANFRDTTFDDAAATPIAAGTPPFAGSYRPSDPLSALAGQNGQGTWVLEVGDFVGGSGTVNSWSLIIQPAGSPNTAAGASAQHGGTPLPLAAPPPLPAPITMLPFAGRFTAGRVGSTAAETAGALVPFPLSDPMPLTPQAAGNTVLAGPAGALPAGPAALLVGAEPVVVQPGAGLDTPFAGDVRDGRRGDPAGADNPIGMGGAGALVNGVNDDVAL
jgi:hypothetical protein